VARGIVLRVPNAKEDPLQLHIENMTCGSCVTHVTQTIRTVDPNAKVDADTTARTVTVDTAASREDIQEVVAADGYRAQAA
jgi:copper chaperone